MNQQASSDEIGESDVTAAVESLNSPSFKQRLVRTDRNAPDPDWRAPSGQTISDHVRDRLDHFKKDVEVVRLHHFHGGVFHRLDADTTLTVAHHDLVEPAPPTARDLLHVYGPDRDDIKDWKRYYRYAWKDTSLNAQVYSDDVQIIREGKLACTAYAYSGQSSYSLVGAGLFFRPLFGDAKLSIRPYVQWQTSSSFTGTHGVHASVAASVGIYVQSWAQGGGGHNVDRDHWIPVWSQGTQSYTVGVTAGGAATVGDGLATEIPTVTQRKYNIFVYVWLETSAGQPQERNVVRFARIDMDATVPFVVLEETLA